jgi:hypothetical protein
VVFDPREEIWPNGHQGHLQQFPVLRGSAIHESDTSDSQRGLYCHELQSTLRNNDAPNITTQIVDSEAVIGLEEVVIIEPTDFRGVPVHSMLATVCAGSIMGMAPHYRGLLPLASL